MDLQIIINTCSLEFLISAVRKGKYFLLDVLCSMYLIQQIFGTGFEMKRKQANERRRNDYSTLHKIYVQTCNFAILLLVKI